MSSDLDWLSHGLPTFHGGKDRTLARKMIDGLGGPSGFKTDKTTGIDGSVTTVQLKGDMPPQVTVDKTEGGGPNGRTFVFNEVGSTTGMISNRNGSGMKTVLYPYTVVPFASYKVGPRNTSGNGKRWNDVWRLDSAKFVANGNPSATGPDSVTYNTSYPSPVPYLVKYVPPTTSPTDRTALFTGSTEGDDYGPPHFGVSNITFNGVQVDSLVVSGVTYYQENATGINVSPQGDFHFYWLERPSNYVTHHAVMRPAVIGPPSVVTHEIVDSGYGDPVQLNLAVTGTFDTSQSKKVSCTFGQTTIQWADAGIKDSGGHPWHVITEVYSGSGQGFYGEQTKTKTDQIACSDGYSFYTGSPLETTLSIAISGNDQWREWGSGSYPWVDDPPGSTWVIGGGGSWFDFSSSSSTSVSLRMGNRPPLHRVEATVACDARTNNTFTQTISYSDIPSSISYFMGSYPGDNYGAFLEQHNINQWQLNIDGYGNHHAPIGRDSRESSFVSDPDTSTHRTDTFTLQLESNDYLFLDVDEDISLRLHAEYNYGYSHTGPWLDSVTLWQQYPPSVCHLTVKYILDVRGGIVEFPVFDGAFTEPVLTITSYGDPDWISPRFNGFLLPGRNLIPILNPVMEQGKCAFIAYTTKAEEAAGATPEFYLDALVKCDPLVTSHGAAMQDPWRFNPRQMGSLFTNYLGHWADGSDTGVYKSILYGPPIRLQYAKGIANPWPEKLGAPFTASSHVEITRI